MGSQSTPNSLNNTMSEAPAGGKFCLVLLEGIGCSDSDERNAVKKANMEYLNSLKVNENCIYTELDAHGECVCLASCLHCRWDVERARRAPRLSRPPLFPPEGDVCRIASCWITRSRPERSRPARLLPSCWRTSSKATGAFILSAAWAMKMLRMGGALHEP